MLKLGAPQYWHKEEDRPATEEEVVGYESIASLFSEEEFKIRNATLEERFKWLDSHRSGLKDDLSRLEELLDKKTKEYIKIDSEASERLSELSELKSKRKAQEERISGLESKSEHLSETIIKLERAQREETQNLLKQSHYLKGISFQDLDRREEAQRLHEELSLAKPKRFGDGFVFTNAFVDRLKKFVFDVAEKLEQAVNQNEFLRRSLKGMTEVNKQVEARLAEEEYESQRLLEENRFLRQENKELKRSKTLLDDIQEVITEKEVNSLNQRLEGLRRSRKRDEPKRSKGRSI